MHIFIILCVFYVVKYKMFTKTGKKGKFTKKYLK
jgi:hypothetical protein